MAQIVLNGGSPNTKLRIVPQQPPALVRAYRELEAIRRDLEHFQQVFVSSPATLEGFANVRKESIRLKEMYCHVLENCTYALRQDIDSMPQEQRAYYLPVLIFLSRANDAHTILPHTTYFHSWSMMVESPDSVMEFFPHIPSLPNLRGFIEERIAESIVTCSAYCDLLSNSLGSSMRFFPLNQMVFRIAKIQQEVSIHHRAHTLHSANRRDELSKLRAQHARGLQLDLELTGEIFGLPNLSYFLIEQLISNAFKASFGAYWVQQTSGGNCFVDTEYNELGPLNKPRVKITLERVDDGHVKFVISDNGLGVPVGMLDRLLESDRLKRLLTFGTIQVSNGSSTSLFPFLADLMGVEMTLSSKDVGKGFTAELVFPMDINIRD